jgi:glycosyltransferase involved in cell wall biosynthesis
MRIVIVGYPNKKSSGVRTHVNSLKNGLEIKDKNVEIMDTELTGVKRIIVSLMLRIFNIVSKEFSQKARIYIFRHHLKNIAPRYLIEGTILNIQSVLWYEIIKPFLVDERMPIVLTVHGAYSEELREKGYTEKFVKESFKLEQAIYNKVNRIVTVGKSMAEYIYNVSGRKDINIIPNGIISSEFLGNINTFEEVRCVFIGRLQKYKGVDFAIEALSKVAKSNVNATLDIIGDGPEKKNLVQYAKILKVSDKIRFLGLIPNDEVRRQLYNYDVSLIPSIPFGENGEESFNYVCIESMNAGLLTIASDIGGLGRIITNNYDGILVTPGDSDSIANSIKTYYYNKGNFINMRKNAQTTVLKKYTSKSMAVKFIKVFESLIKFA